MSSMRVAHFLNQFFGGIGGEEKANLPVRVENQPIGPGRLLEKQLADRGHIVTTLICGDNYLNERREDALAEIRKALSTNRPDVVVAGPAFDAGRYGLACGEVCQLAGEMGIPAVTAMHPENPGVLTFHRDVVIVPTGASASDMASALNALSRIAVKLGHREELGPAAEEGYLPRGFRRPGLREKPAAERAIDMLVAKATDRPFVTELPVELPEIVTPAPPVLNLRSARLALITTGGLVPKGNPDRLVRGNSKVWLTYSIAELDALSADDWECVHRGFYTNIVNENPNYILPLDIARELQHEDVFADLHPDFFSTSGVGTAVVDARRMGQEMAAELRRSDVDGVLLVAT